VAAAITRVVSACARGSCPDGVERMASVNDRWTPGRRVPALPTHPAHTICRVVKDSRWAEGRVREVPHGRELRFVVGGTGRIETLMQSAVYCPSESAELAEMSAGTLQNFVAHGWTLDETTRPSA
jgi:hypothetical protein